MRKAKQWFINKFIRKFPFDCNGCRYFLRYDMSVDDWTNKCRINGMEKDDCDLGFYKKLYGHLRGATCPKYKIRFK